MSLALVLTGAAAVTAYSEFMPYVRSGVLVDQKVATLVETAISPGPSFRSKYLVLADCNAALNSLRGNTLPAEQRQALLLHCQSMAQAVAAEQPTQSFAWYIDALTAEGLSDEAGMDAALVRSQQTAPQQEWLARSRAILADRHRSTLSADALKAYDLDLALLIDSVPGVAWVAQRYRSDTDFRERITSIVETLPAEQQRRFISAVRSAGR